jgi:HPt (histidine-containing phosphotransfer) domain-containing protein
MTGPTLDPTTLDDLRVAMGSDDLVVDIIEAFLTGTPGQIDSLVEAGQRGDLPAVVTLAHLIKGSALTFGAVRVVELCQALESAPSDPDGRVTALAGEFEKLAASLSVYLEALPER